MQVRLRGGRRPLSATLYRTKAEVATDILRGAILAGELPPGEPLTAAAVAERYGLTRMPLREALSRLAAEGLVQIAAHQPARVVGFSRARLDEEYFVRALLEAAAAAGATPHLDDRAFRELEELLRRMDRARDDGRTAEFWMLTRRFHERIYAACPSALLRDEVERVRVRTLRYQPALSRDQELMTRAQAEHWEILRALRARDAGKVERLLRGHVTTLAHALKLGEADRPQRPAAVGE